MKRKPKQIPLLVTTAFFCLAGYFGMTVMIDSFDEYAGPLMPVVTIVGVLFFVYFAQFVQIIVHEAGHLAGGLLSGYHFVSFRIARIMIKKENDQLKLKRYSLPGTAGQCLMAPPAGDMDNFPYFLYNIGGAAANLIFGVLCFILYLIFRNVPFLSSFFVITFIIGLLFAFLNGIPMKINGIANDGANISALRSDPFAMRALGLQLRVNALLSAGTRIRDMPREWFDLPDTADLDNPLICAVGFLQCGYLHDMQKFDEAKRMSEFMIEKAPGTLSIYKNELQCELLFYEIIGECRRDEIDKLYTQELQKYIKATNLHVSKKRLLYAYELFVNHDPETAAKVLAAFKKTAKSYPYPAEIEAERELIAIIRPTGG